MRNRCGTGLAALLGLSMLAGTSQADEEKIPVEKLPAAVTKAVKKKFPKARIEACLQGGRGWRHDV